jgi:hypothetical protein
VLEPPFLDPCDDLFTQHTPPTFEIEIDGRRGGELLS